VPKTVTGGSFRAPFGRFLGFGKQRVLVPVDAVTAVAGYHAPGFPFR
jgi:hypothetical protein